MPLSVALPSFDAFLRSSRRSPAVLPLAPPTSFYRPYMAPLDHHTTTYDDEHGYYDDHDYYTKSNEYPRASTTPPGSPYYGHFVSLSPTSSAGSDSWATHGTATTDQWSGSGSGSGSEMDHDLSEYTTPRPTATWYQDMIAQPTCIAIAPKPKPRAAVTASSTAQSKPLSGALRAKKKYLKERQRCEIVRRVRNGEKQAHLAKEFGVSRAAVCYLLKHEYDILRRSALRQQRKLNKRM